MQKGFTLIELMVVIVIVAIIACVAVPQFFHSRHHFNPCQEYIK